MIAYSIKIECEDDGFHIVIDGDSIDPDYQAGQYGWKIEDPEALYDAVRAEIGPWLHERELARKSSPTPLYVDDSGYDLLDPKHPTFRERMSDLWDNRDKTERTPW